MSETVHYRGKLKKVERVGNEKLEDQCKRLINNVELDSFYDSYTEMLLDQYYEKYILYNNNLYLIEEKEEIDAYNDIFTSHKIDDKTIQFEVKYYNGGCGFSEAIDYALENIK